MKKILEILSEQFEIGARASVKDMEATESHFNYKFPFDYKAFLLFSNGLEGETKDNYLVLWSMEELIKLNAAYHVREFISDVIIFGSDGAENAYGFDVSKSGLSIIRLPFIGMGYIPNEKISNSFEEFLIAQIGDPMRARI